MDNKVTVTSSEAEEQVRKGRNAAAMGADVQHELNRAATHTISATVV
jgi:hypothetical protein